MKKNLSHDADPRFQIVAYAYISGKDGKSRNFVCRMRANPNAEDDDWIPKKILAEAKKSKTPLIKGLASNDCILEIYWPKTNQSKAFSYMK